MFYMRFPSVICFPWQAKSLVSAPMENCFSNLMHNDGKGLLSLILSLIGLNVNRYSSRSNLSACPWHSIFSVQFSSERFFVADHHLAGAGEGVPEGDAAVCPAGAPVCSEESVGGGAAVCGPVTGQRSHHGHHGLARANYAGHQAGKSYL